MHRKKFPQYLNSPFQILWFESDELGVMMACFTVAMLVSNIFTWALAFAGPYFYSKAKRKYPRGFFKHMLYYMGLIKIEGYPSAFIKEFRE